ncbi:MAG: 50S ribosomal protein L29 [Ilumatobacteraceae bacterium]
MALGNDKKSAVNAQLKEMDLADLVEALRAAKQEALNLRFRNATGQLDRNSEIRRVRRQIARINSYIRAREIALAEGGK